MKTPAELAEAIIDRANDNYHVSDSGYPPFALAPWDDRIRWSDYLKKVATEVLTEELSKS